MKLHTDAPAATNRFTAYGTGFVEIDGQRHAQPLLAMPGRPVSAWDAPGFDALANVHFEALLALAPEVVLLGTGERQRFPHPRITAPLLNAGIGVEVMDTGAACRTYNILVSEGRRVLAALLLD